MKIPNVKRVIYYMPVERLMKDFLTELERDYPDYEWGGGQTPLGGLKFWKRYGEKTVLFLYPADKTIFYGDIDIGDPERYKNSTVVLGIGDYRYAENPMSLKQFAKYLETLPKSRIEEAKADFEPELKPKTEKVDCYYYVELGDGSTQYIRAQGVADIFSDPELDVQTVFKTEKDIYEIVEEGKVIFAGTQDLISKKLIEMGIIREVK